MTIKRGRPLAKYPVMGLRIQATPKELETILARLTPRERAEVLLSALSQAPCKVEEMMLPILENNK